MTIQEYLFDGLNLSKIQVEAVMRLADVCGLQPLMEFQLATAKKQSAAATEQFNKKQQSKADKAADNPSKGFSTDGEDNDEYKTASLDELMGAASWNDIFYDENGNPTGGYTPSSISRQDVNRVMAKDETTDEDFNDESTQAVEQTDVRKVIMAIGELAAEPTAVCLGIASQAADAISLVSEDRSKTEDNWDEAERDRAFGWDVDERLNDVDKLKKMAKQRGIDADSILADEPQSVGNTTQTPDEQNATIKQSIDRTLKLVAKANEKIALRKSIQDADAMQRFNSKVNALYGLVYEFTHDYPSDPFGDAFKTVDGYDEYQGKIDSAVSKPKYRINQNVSDSYGRRYEPIEVKLAKVNQSRKRSGRPKLTLDEYKQMIGGQRSSDDDAFTAALSTDTNGAN